MNEEIHAYLMVNNFIVMTVKDATGTAYVGFNPTNTTEGGKEVKNYYVFNTYDTRILASALLERVAEIEKEKGTTLS